MKSTTLQPLAFCLALLALMCSSCKKEIANSIAPDTTKGAGKPKMHLYTDTANGSFNYFSSQTGIKTLKPTISSSWYMMAGIGNNIQMPNTTTLCNQLLGFPKPGISFIAAPVIKFFRQKLALEGFPDIPESVSCINYDHTGNSIWFHLEPTTKTWVNADRLEFSGTSTVVGGTGIFEAATGTVTTSGYFNMVDDDDAGIGNRGVILY